MITHSDDYQTRMSEPNWAEKKFEMWCFENSYPCERFGFNQDNNLLKNFFKLHPSIRNFPDFVIERKDKIAYCHVKGTNKIKLEDFIDYNLFDRLFCTPESPLYLVFVFQDAIKFRTVEQVKALLVGREIKRFENDGKIYFDLKIT